MATYKTLDAVGNREDLSDVIAMLDVDETPFISNIGTAKATAKKHEWQTDSLGTAAVNNIHQEGADFSSGTVTPTVRLNNNTQIFKKQIQISGTQEAVDKAGRASEMDYQTAKQLRQLKMDVEATACGNQTVRDETSTLASRLRSLEAWYATNDSRGVGGADGSTTQAAVDATTGDLRVFTEDLLKNVLQDCYTAGGNPNLVIAGPHNKRVLSGFAGNATRMIDNMDKKLVTSVDVYVSDFGELKIVPSRHTRARTVHVIDTDYWKIADLRPTFSEPLSKTGDSIRKHIVRETTLESLNEASSGVIADLETI